MKIINYNQCGKNFAKGFNLKVYILNVHEIEKISTKPHAYEPINDNMENGNDWHFENYKIQM